MSSYETMTDDMDLQDRIDTAPSTGRWAFLANPPSDPHPVPRKRKKDPGDMPPSQVEAAPPTPSPAKKGKRVCLTCGLPGHYRKTCSPIKECCRNMINRHERDFDTDFLTLRLSCGGCAQVWTWTIGSYAIDQDAMAIWHSKSNRLWEREE